VTLLICPIRPGDSNEELRYAMRSWETNLILDDLTLMTVGYCPSWVKPDWHVEGNRYESMPLAVFDNVMLGAQRAVNMDEDTTIYMNDDFFCMDPVGAVLPVRRDCTLAEHVGQFSPGASTWWPASLRVTADWLRSKGFTQPWSYEAHRPLLVDAEGMVSALSQWDGAPDAMVPQWRTVYGVLNRVEAYPIKDAKLSALQTGVGTPWISTTDQVWRRYASGMKARFQKPSRWEIG